MENQDYSKLHYLHLYEGKSYLISDDDKVHWNSWPFSYLIEPVEPYTPDVPLNNSTFVGNVRVENNRMVPKGNFSSHAQTLYFEFEQDKFKDFVEMLKKLIPDSFTDDDNELHFVDESRLSLKHLPFYLNQFDGPYAWLCLFKAQKEGFASLTDGKSQLTHIDQLNSPMKEQLKSLNDFIELFELTGHEFNGESYAFVRPKLTL